MACYLYLSPSSCGGRRRLLTLLLSLLTLLSLCLRLGCLAIRWMCRGAGGAAHAQEEEVAPGRKLGFCCGHLRD